MYTNFHWIFLISYIQRIWIFPQIWIFCTCNVHNFPMNFHDSVHSTNSNFSTNLDVLFVKCTKFYVEFSRYHTFNEFKFFHVFILSIHLLYSIFLCVLMISYIWRIQFFSQIQTFYTSSVQSFPLNFHYIVHSLIFYFSMNPYFLSIQCTEFPLNFLNIIHSTNLSFSPNLDSLYV